MRLSETRKRSEKSVNNWREPAGGGTNQLPSVAPQFFMQVLSDAETAPRRDPHDSKADDDQGVRLWASTARAPLAADGDGLDLFDT